MSRSRFALSALAAMLLAAAPSVQAVDLQSIPGTDTKLQVYGFVMVYANAFIGGTQAGSPGTASSMFYDSNPLNQGGLEKGTFNLSYAPTRFGFASTTPSAALGDITTKIEYDLNSSNDHLRHAYIKVGGFTIGRAWSLWTDLDAGADTVDWAGPIGSACYDTPRLALVEYSTSLDKHNSLAVSLEQNNGNGDGVVGPGKGTISSKIPTLIGAYTYTGDWGHVGLRAMAQNYESFTGSTNPAVSSTSFSKEEGAVQVSGDVKIAKDDLIFSVYNGSALGQYGNGFQSAQITVSTQTIEAYKSTGWLLGYTHNWTDAVRSNLVVSGVSYSSDSSIATTNSTNGTDMKTMNNVFVNTIVKLSKSTELGFEYVYETAKGFGSNVAVDTDGTLKNSVSDSKLEVALTAHF
jgi:hypothetical protein